MRKILGTVPICFLIASSSTVSVIQSVFINSLLYEYMITENKPSFSTLQFRNSKVVWDNRKPWFCNQLHLCACQFFLCSSPAAWVPKDCAVQTGTPESERKAVTSQGAREVNWRHPWQNGLWTPYTHVALVTCLDNYLNLWFSASSSGRLI